MQFSLASAASIDRSFCFFSIKTLNEQLNVNEKKTNSLLNFPKSLATFFRALSQFKPTHQIKWVIITSICSAFSALELSSKYSLASVNFLLKFFKTSVEVAKTKQSSLLMHKPQWSWFTRFDTIE